jgi:hypothetical protein
MQLGHTMGIRIDLKLQPDFAHTAAALPEIAAALPGIAAALPGSLRALPEICFWLHKDPFAAA